MTAWGIVEGPRARRRNNLIFPALADNRAAFVCFPTGNMKTPQNDRVARFAMGFNKVVNASKSAADPARAFGAAAACFASFQALSGWKLPPEGESGD
jgi:hypothetical protein